MDLNEKIKLILSQKGISPSLFADEIGIQRSSISHILAGRNKPSLDIVQKIVKRFPDLGLNWILDDQELPAIQSDVNSYKSVVKPVEIKEKAPVETPAELRVRKQVEPTPVRKNVEDSKRLVEPEKNIERILIFYSDGTFREFKQS
ncbi:helix-turn-helix transcriptional regulator [Dyadobacter psychrotolerans]|uniref:XRE family transcriptional regulator n=1 Tax=Dyadobacter psychrotolerans TaxID=2541721 RepID=A0A4R5DYY5_9BACT|nr:helix-turn-helix transcriptional regulator [Dyadobacter psychrotolerans]TDE17760.1 XRE family transcriptional regulator [Dyadobacter psychrotolerans]